MAKRGFLRVSEGQDARSERPARVTRAIPSHAQVSLATGPRVVLNPKLNSTPFGDSR